MYLDGFVKILVVVIIVTKAALTTKHGGCKYTVLKQSDSNHTHSGSTANDSSGNNYTSGMSDSNHASGVHGKTQDEKAPNGTTTTNSELPVMAKSLFNIIIGLKQPRTNGSSEIGKNYVTNNTKIARSIQNLFPNRVGNNGHVQDSSVQRTRHNKQTENDGMHADDGLTFPGLKIVLVTGSALSLNQSTTRRSLITSAPRRKNKGPLGTFITVFLLMLILGGFLFALAVACYPHFQSWNRQRRSRRRLVRTNQANVHTVTRSQHLKHAGNKLRAHEYNSIGQRLDVIGDIMNDLDQTQRTRNMMISFNDNDDENYDDNDDETCSVPFTPVSGFAPSPIASRTPATTPRNATGRGSQVTLDSTSKKLPRTSTHRYANVPVFSSSANSNRSISWDNTDPINKSAKNKLPYIFPAVGQGYGSSSNSSNNSNNSNKGNQPDSGVLSDMTSKDQSLTDGGKRSMNNSSKTFVPNRFFSEGFNPSSSFSELPGNPRPYCVLPGYGVSHAPLVANNEISL